MSSQRPLQFFSYDLRREPSLTATGAGRRGDSPAMDGASSHSPTPRSSAARSLASECSPHFAFVAIHCKTPAQSKAQSAGPRSLFAKFSDAGK